MPKIEKQSGFTLLEMLLVVTIFAVVLASSFSLSNSQLFEDDLQAKILEVSALVERARNNSVTGYRGDVWGIKVLNNNAICESSGDCIVLFKGRRFSIRNSSYDAFVQFNQNITGVSLADNQENEFYFEYGSGWLSTTTPSTLARQELDQQYITLNNNVGEEQSVLVSPTGAISSFVCGEDQVFDVSGHGYNTVKIGSNCWTAENINTGTMLASVSTEPSNNSSPEKWCYGDTASNCDTYGGLYNWNEAMGYVTTAGAQGICPNGWHVPSTSEFNLLDDYHSANNLKIGGNSGFDILAAGMRLDASPDIYNYIYGVSGDGGAFWSSNQNGSQAYYYWSEEDMSNFDQYSVNKTYGFSIRCIKDY